LRKHLNLSRKKAYEIVKEAKARAKKEKDEREVLERQKAEEEKGRMKQDAEDRVKEFDYKNTLLLFGIDAPPKMSEKEKEKNDDILKNLIPSEEKDFMVLAKAIATRVECYNTNYNYMSFLKDLAKEIVEPASSEDVSDLMKSMTAILNDKLKNSKPKKPKVTTKAKGKLLITKGADNDFEFDDLDAVDRDDGDDFM